MDYTPYLPDSTPHITHYGGDGNAGGYYNATQTIMYGFGDRNGYGIINGTGWGDGFYHGNGVGGGHGAGPKRPQEPLTTDRCLKPAFWFEVFKTNPSGVLHSA